VLSASGPLHKPKLSGTKGVDKFKGVQFHTSRWNYQYTGGSPLGGLAKLADKRVAVIGGIRGLFLGHYV
jgi:cyclohexanone monooxygenase